MLFSFNKKLALVIVSIFISVCFCRTVLADPIDEPFAIPELLEFAPPDTSGWMLVDPLPPEYTWWNGCSPTAAGMLFAWWDDPNGGGMTNLYDGDATVWDKANMNDENEAHYVKTHAMVASWEHKEAGKDLSLTYGSWKNHTANSIADFLQTSNGGTYRSKMAQGFIDFAIWDDPDTLINESYDNVDAWTMYNWTGFSPDVYRQAIDNNQPVHLGISGTYGHSVLGVGYDANDPIDNYICWTTWGGWSLTKWRWDGISVPYDMAVYGATFLEISEPIPEPATILLLSLSLFGLVCLRKKIKLSA